MIKRLMDVAISGVALVLAAPLMVVIWVLVRLESPGEPIYKQVRVGRDGAPFEIYKFRTMVTGAEFIGAGLAVQEGDARITRMGKLLRKTSLDELPNLVNVLRGEMSIVGPRPTVQVQVDHYSERQRGRLKVKPGITGWAQIHGRASLPWSQRIELDLYYVEHQSLKLDLQILARTPAMLLGRKGIYKGDAGGWDITDEIPEAEKSARDQSRAADRRRAPLRHRARRSPSTPPSSRATSIRSRRRSTRRRSRSTTCRPTTTRASCAALRALVAEHEVGAVLPLIDPDIEILAQAREDGELPAMVPTPRSRARRTTRSPRTSCSSRTACRRRRRSRRAATSTSRSSSSRASARCRARCTSPTTGARRSSSRSTSASPRCGSGCSGRAHLDRRARRLGRALHQRDPAHDARVARRRGGQGRDPATTRRSSRSRRATMDALRVRGPGMIQLFRDPELGIGIHDVNLRFGGGFAGPMYAALPGRSFPELIVRMASGEAVEPHVGEYRKGIYFARFNWQIELDEHRGLDRAGRAARPRAARPRPRPTAIVSLTDQNAIGRLRAARAMAIAAPAQLSVTGFDDAAPADDARPHDRAPTAAEKCEPAGRLIVEGRAPEGRDVIVPGARGARLDRARRLGGSAS